jgi:predicted dinucleotide-binding enzyme
VVRESCALTHSTTPGEELARKLPNARVVKAFSTIPASLIPHVAYKVVVRQLIRDSGFVGLDAGRLRMAKELETPGRMNRAGPIGIAQAKRVLSQLSNSHQTESLASYICSQPAFIEEARAPEN